MVSTLRVPIKNFTRRKSLTGHMLIAVDLICKEGSGGSIPLPTSLTVRVQVTDTDFVPVDHLENYTYVYPWEDNYKLINLISNFAKEYHEFDITLACTDLDILMYSENHNQHNGLKQFYNGLEYYDMELKSFSNKKIKFYAYKQMYLPELATKLVPLSPSRILLTDIENYFDYSEFQEVHDKDCVLSNATIKSGHPKAGELSKLKVDKIIADMLDLLSLTCSDNITPVSMSNAAFTLLKSKYVMPEFLREKYPNVDTLIYTHNVPRIKEIEGKASHGARTEVYYHGKYPDKVYQIDINNLYGYIMQNSVVPTNLVFSQPTLGIRRITIEEQIRNVLADLGYPRDVDLSSLTEQPKTARCIIAEVTVNIPSDLVTGPVAVEPTSVGKTFDNLASKPSIIFPTGIFTVYVTTEMFKYLASKGYIIGVVKHCIYDGLNILKYLVDDMHKLRNCTLEDGTPDRSKRQLAKRIVNLISGKFAQKEYATKSMTDDLHEYREGTNIIHDNHLETKIVQMNGKLFEIGKADKYSKQSFPAIYAHITDNARLFMYQQMEKIGFENILYIDNDGLIVNQVGYDKIKGDIDPSILGKFKLEHEGYVDIKGNKTYTLYSGENHTGEILKEVKVGIPKGKETTGEGFVRYSSLSISSDNKLTIEHHSVHINYDIIPNRVQNGTPFTKPFDIFYLGEV